MYLKRLSAVVPRYVSFYGVLVGQFLGPLFPNIVVANFAEQGACVLNTVLQ